MLHSHTKEPQDQQGGTIHASSSLIKEFSTPNGHRRFVENFHVLVNLGLKTSKHLDLKSIRQDIAQKTECTVDDIQGFIDGTRRPNLREASRIAGYFRLSLRMMISPDLKRRAERTPDFIKPTSRK